MLSMRKKVVASGEDTEYRQLWDDLDYLQRESRRRSESAAPHSISSSRSGGGHIGLLPPSSERQSPVIMAAHDETGLLKTPLICPDSPHGCVRQLAKHPSASRGSYVVPALPTPASLSNSSVRGAAQASGAQVSVENLPNEVIDDGSKDERGKVDCFDYDDCISIVRLMEEREIAPGEWIKIDSIRWVLTILIAIITALVGRSIIESAHLLYSVKASWFYRLVSSSCPHWIAIGTRVSMDLGLVMIAASLVAFVEPIAFGSGIPQVKCILNGLKLPRVVRAKTMLVKAIGVACGIGSGLPLGTEGPMVHCGAVVGAGISQGKSTTMGVDTSVTKFLPFRNDKEKRDFISCGTAAGVACAFGAPIGGVMFALEEGSSFWNQSLTIRSFVAAQVCYFVFILFDAISGESLGSAKSFIFGAFVPNFDHGRTYSLVEIPIIVVLGCFGGVLGAIFNQANKRLTEWRFRHATSPCQRFSEVCAITIIFSFTVLALSYYAFYEHCLPVTDENLTIAVQASTEAFFCGRGMYNPAATLLLSPGTVAIKHLFHSQRDFHIVTLVTLFIVIFVFSCITYGSSIPSGLFVPVMVAGAALGRLFGQVLRSHVETISAGNYALIGAAAGLGSVCRLGISLVVILVEATGQVQFGIPIMLSVMTAKWVGDYFNKSIYDMHIDLQGLPFLEWEAPKIASFMLSMDLMTRSVHYFFEVEPVSRIVDVLRSTSHSSYPVVSMSSNQSRTMRFRGIVKRTTLTTLLQRRAFKSYPPIPYQMAPPVPDSEIRKQYPRYPSIESIDLSKEEMQQYLDITPYINISPFVIQEQTPVNRAWRLIRSLGLRTIPVLSKNGDLVGILSRKDLAESTLKEKLRFLCESGRLPPQMMRYTKRSRWAD